MNGRREAALLSAALVVAISSPLRAQSIDYGGLQQLFNEPVTTSATGLPQRVTEVPATMEIITAEDIRRSGADNIPDILQFIAGIDVRRYGIDTAEVAIRGYSQPANPRLLVMVNGRQVYLDDYGYVAWSAIPVQLDEIRQIEVVKGPNSALFGFNAAAGVINIVTYDPLHDHAGALTVRTGTQGLNEESIVATVQLGATAAIRISGGSFAARDFSPIGLSAEDTFFRKPPRHAAFNLSGRWQIAPNIELMAEGSAVDSRTTENLGGLYYDLHYRTNSLRAGGTADTSFGLLSLDFYRNQAHMLYHSLLLGDEPVTDTVYVVKANDLFRMDAENTIRLGLEFRDNSAEGRDYSGQVGYYVYAGDVMWNWNISPDFSLTNAIRLDELSLHYRGTLVPGSGLTLSQYANANLTALSFNSGAIWKASDLDTLRLTAARGLQAPSLDDFGVQLPGNPASIGNPNLSPTFVWNVALGYDRSMPEIGSLLRLNVFAQRNDDLLGSNWFANPDVLPGGLFASQAQNIGSSDTAGFEAGLKGNSPLGFRWNASYSFISVSDRIKPAAANLAFSYAHATPQHAVILGGGYTNGRWEFDAQGRWQSEFQDFRLDQPTFQYMPVNIKDYITFSARIAYRLADVMTIALTAEQLGQRRILENNGPPVERRLIFSTTIPF